MTTPREPTPGGEPSDAPTPERQGPGAAAAPDVPPAVPRAGGSAPVAEAAPAQPPQGRPTGGADAAQRPTAPAGPGGATSAGDPGPGWAASRRPAEAPPTTVLPSGGRPARQVPARPAPGTPARPAAAASTRPAAGRTRRARLSLRRIDPWSVFLFSLLASVLLGIALVVAVAVLYAVLGSLGVTGSLNELFAEVSGGNASTEPLLTSGRIVGGAAVLSAVNIVLLTLLATLGALLYNVCSSFTGGLELTFGERD